MAKTESIGAKIKKEYIEAWNYIKESKNYIYFSVILFLIIFIIGLFRPPFLTDEIGRLLTDNTRSSALSIFFHNLSIDISKLFLGVILGIVPFIISNLNAYVIGFIVAENITKFLHPWFVFGFITLICTELIVSFVATGLGLKFGTVAFRKNRLKTFKNYLLNNIRVGLLVITPMLFISAFIEYALIALLS